MAAHVGQLTSLDAMRGCFQAVTAEPAGIMGLQGYGLEPGCADLVVLEAADPIEAIRRPRACSSCAADGSSPSRPPRMARLDLPGRPPAVSFLNPLASV